MRKLTAEEFEYLKKVSSSTEMTEKGRLAQKCKGKISAALTAYENISQKCIKESHKFVHKFVLKESHKFVLSEFKCISCGCAFPYDRPIPEDMTPADYVKNQFKEKSKGFNLKFGRIIIQCLIEMNDSGVSESLDALTCTDIRRFLLLILKSKVNVGAVLAKNLG